MLSVIVDLTINAIYVFSVNFYTYILMANKQSRRANSRQGDRMNLACDLANAGRTSELAYLLCDCNVPVDTRDAVGLTLLHLAAKNGHTETVLLLLSLGAKKDSSIGANGTPLHQAALCGHATTVGEMLKEGCSVYAYDSNGCSVLHAAAVGGNAEIIGELVSAGCNINSRNNDGSTPLHLAEMQGNTKAALALKFASMILATNLVKEGNTVELGCLIADSDIPMNTNVSGGTLLHLAAAHGHNSTVSLLLELGADMAEVAGEEGIPLHQAALYGHVSIVKTLLEAGSPVDVKDSKGRRILHSAADGGSVEVIKEVASSEPQSINALDSFGVTPLHRAAAKGNTEAALILIKLGAEKAKLADNFGTPLHLAARCGHVSTVRALLKAGCPVDVVASGGYNVLHAAVAGGNAEVIRELKVANEGRSIDTLNTLGVIPLHQAVASEMTETVEELIRLGAEKVTVAGTLGTPLHLAALNGNNPMVKALLKAGCPVDVVNSNGCNILHAAAKCCNAEVITEIVNEGKLHVDAYDEHGATPLHWAAEHGNTEAALKLIEYGAKTAIIAGRLGTPLHQAAGHGHVSTVKAMLKAGCPVDVVASNDASVLHFAAAGGNAEVIREVASKGHPLINACDSYGATPLHWAALLGKTEAALELIKQSAEKAVVAGRFGTPLHQAALYGHLLTVKALLKAGCPVDVVDSLDQTVLHYAVLTGNAEIVREVLNTGQICIDARTASGMTPLHLAVVRKDEEMEDELLKHGASSISLDQLPICDADARNIDDWLQSFTEFHDSATVAPPDSVTDEKYVRSANVNSLKCLPENENASLHFVAANGNVETIRQSSGMWCDIDAKDDYGLTALHWAAGKGRTEVALELIEHGAEKTKVAKGFGTPLHQAAANGHTETLRMLLDKDCPAGILDEEGATPLHYAALWGNNNETISLLLQEKCTVSCRDQYGLTPLHFAVLGRCPRRCEQTIVTLLEHGACASEKCPVFGTASDLAYICGKSNISDMLSDEAHLQKQSLDEFVMQLTNNPHSTKEGDLHYAHALSKLEYGVLNFEHALFLCDSPEKSRLCSVLPTLISDNQVDVDTLACLVAIHGDATVLECIDEYIKTCAVSRSRKFFYILKDLFPQLSDEASDSSSYFQTSVTDDECPINLFQLAIFSWKCTEDYIHHACLHRSSLRYPEIIKKLTTIDSFRHTLNEYLPNGLTLLDLAEELRLNEAVNIIEEAGGRRGILSVISKEVRLPHQHRYAALLAYQELEKVGKSGPLGEQAVQAVFSQFMEMPTTAEQDTMTGESFLHQQKVLDQRPDLSIISTYVIGLVNVERWRRLGISLKIPQEVLTHISSTHSSCEDRYLEVLIYWVEHNEVASWRTLLEVLGHFETKHTMDQLTQEVLATQGSDSAVS